MVKIEIIEERDDHVTVLLKDTDRAFANALRRTLMSDVPKMAIHRVRFELGSIEDDGTGETYESVGALPRTSAASMCFDADGKSPISTARRAASMEADGS